VLRRLILALGAFSAAASAGRAQQRADTAAALVVFNEVLTPRELAFVVLSQGIAYRVEVIPRGATVAIRSVRPGPPPLTFRPLRDPAQVEEGASYLIVPSISEEYRVVVGGVNEPVRIRIIQDPRETRILAGQGRAPGGVMTLGARGVAWFGGFSTVRGTAPQDTVEQGTAAGIEGCIGVSAGHVRELPWLTGCLLTVGVFAHSTGATLLMVGTAPAVVISRPMQRVQVALAPHIAVGRASVPFRRDVVYLSAGGGPSFTVPFGSRLTLEAAAAVAIVHHGGYTRPPGPFSTQPTSVAGGTGLAFRLTAGLELRL
jgi:hypothetical protein